MKTYIVVLGAAVAVLSWSGSLAAHHSLARFDTTTPVWVTGTVIRIERINPHSLIVIDQPRSHQPAQRWVIDGPSPNVLARMRLADDFVRPGEVLTVCGFVLKTTRRPTRPGRSADTCWCCRTANASSGRTTAYSRSASRRGRTPRATVARPSGVRHVLLVSSLGGGGCCFSLAISPCAAGQRTDRIP